MNISIWYLLRPRCSCSHTSSICCIFTIDNYFSITHLFDVCIASFFFFFLVVEECRLAVFFPVRSVDFWLMCLFRLNDLSNGSFTQVHFNLKSARCGLLLCSWTADWCSHFVIWNLYPIETRLMSIEIETRRRSMCGYTHFTHSSRYTRSFCHVIKCMFVFVVDH